MLSLPLLAADGVVGAMNVYAHPENAFDERAEHLGELFAVPAAIAVQNAQILAQTQRLAANLQAALTNRAVIDRASGILISRGGITAQDAMDRLHAISRQEHTNLAGIAESIVVGAGPPGRAPAHRIGLTAPRPGHGGLADQHGRR